MTPIGIHTAPILADGNNRISLTVNLPPQIKEAIEMIAHDEKRSQSWVVEEIIMDWFGIIGKPMYKKNGTKRG